MICVVWHHYLAHVIPSKYSSTFINFNEKFQPANFTIWSSTLIDYKKGFEIQVFNKKSWVVSFRGECDERGGIAQGSCASGFGVCCICK